MQTENNGVVAAQETVVAAKANVEIHTPYHEALADLNQPAESALAEAVTEPVTGTLADGSDTTLAEVIDAANGVVVVEGAESVQATTVEELDQALVVTLEDSTADAPADIVLEATPEEAQVSEAVAETQLAPTPVEPVAVPAKKKKTFVVANSPFTVAKTVVGLEALKELGFGEPFINSEETRTIVFDIRTGLPVLDENFVGAWKEVTITGKIQAITVLESEHKLVVISAVATENTTFFQVVKEHVFFNFAQRDSFQSPQEVAVALLASNLCSGRRNYEASADIMDGFWFELFKAVYTEPSIINLTLKSGTGGKVPARLYFDPAVQKNGILSVGGVCFDYTLGDYPDRAIVEGTKAYMTEKKKAEDAAKERELNRGGRVIVKQKQERVRASVVAQMKSSAAPVLGYGQLPPAKPIPVKKQKQEVVDAVAVETEAQPAVAE